MPCSIDDIAQDVRKALDLPVGYCVIVDYRTDCIIVANGSEDDVRDAMKSRTGQAHDGTPLWGFAITRNVIDDNLHIDNAKAAFPRLVQIVTNTEYVKSLDKLEW